MPPNKHTHTHKTSRGQRQKGGRCATFRALSSDGAGAIGRGAERGEGGACRRKKLIVGPAAAVVGALCLSPWSVSHKSTSS